jgi:hypothetical protein
VKISITFKRKSIIKNRRIKMKKFYIGLGITLLLAALVAAFNPIRPVRAAHTDRPSALAMPERKTTSMMAQTQSWQEVFAVPAYPFLNDLAVYNGRLYAAVSWGWADSNRTSMLYFTEDGLTWNETPNYSTDLKFIHSLHVYANRLYIGATTKDVDGDSEEEASIYSYDGSAFTHEFTDPTTGGYPGIADFAMHNGELYATYGHEGRIYKRDTAGNWALVGNVSTCGGRDLESYAGALYLGVGYSPTGCRTQLWRDDGSGWQVFADYEDSSGDAVNALAVYANKLYVATAYTDRPHYVFEYTQTPTGTLKTGEWLIDTPYLALVKSELWGSGRPGGVYKKVGNAEWVYTDAPIYQRLEFFNGYVYAAQSGGDGGQTRVFRQPYAYTGPTFTNVAPQLGVANGFHTESAQWADIDNDGDLDLFVAGGNGGSRHYLYENRLNQGEGFVDITAAWGLSTSGLPGWEIGVFGDYDRDGRLDLWLGQSDYLSTLYRNTGSSFQDVTDAVGLGMVRQMASLSGGANWVDYDRDGRLDLFTGEGAGGDEYRAHVFRNNYPNGFTEVDVGIAFYRLSAAWGDYDNDGDLDVVTGLLEDFYRNDVNINGQFTRLPTLLPVNPSNPNATGGYGGMWGDYDNDGFLDLYLGGQTPTYLFHNNGDGTFTDVTAEAGLVLPLPPGDYDWAHAGSWVDFDNDGDLDLHVSTYYSRPDLFYRNDGGVFTEIGADIGLRDSASSLEGSWGDFDGDGDLDFYAVNWASGGPRLWRNDGGNSQHWLNIRLVGQISNRDGVGARITLTTGSRSQTRELNSSGDASENPLSIWFGLGASTAADSIVVRWPSGIEQRLTNVDMGAYEYQEPVAVHLVAIAALDNNLCSYLPDVIEKTRLGTSNNPAVHATLLVDCDQVGDTRVLEIANGVVTQNNVPAFTGELDTADPNVLSGFLAWARAQRPANRTVVALLGHGAGLTPEIHRASDLTGLQNLSGLSSLPPLPIGRDPTPVDVSSGTYLSTPELGRALLTATSNGANPFDVLFLDGCFYGNLDTLYEIRNTASVIVASPNYGWGAFAYDRYLPHFTSSATPEDMAQAIVDEYEAALDDTHPNAIFWVRGSDIAAIANALSSLGDALRAALDLQPSTFHLILDAALAGQFADTTLCAGDRQLCPPDEQMGLRSFAAQLQTRFAPGSDVHTAAGNVLTVLNGVHSNTTNAVGHPWVKPEANWDLSNIGPTIIAPLTPTLALTPGVIWRASLYTSTVPLTAVLSWQPTQTVVITTPWAFTVDGRWDDWIAAWYGPLTPTVGTWCNVLPPALVITSNESLTLTAQGGLVSAQLAWTPVVTSAAVDYAVYVLRPGGGTWELAAIAPLTQTAFTQTDLPSGVYQYFVAARNDQGRAVALSNEASVDVGIVEVNPTYGLNNVPTMVFIRGSGFVSPLTVRLGSIILQDVFVVDAHMLQAVVPAGLAPGVYDVAVSAAAGEAIAYDAFRVIDAAGVDDLVSSPDQLTTNPSTVRANHLTSIEFTLQRLGGKFTLPGVTVAIRINSVWLADAWTPPAPPNSTVGASPVDWLPSAPGDYELCAIIDSSHTFTETDETNNTVCKTITVLPVAIDVTPPVVDGFVINDDASVAPALDVTLDVTAADPLPNASGVKSIEFFEFVWSQGARRWLPVVRSGWVDYAVAHVDYPWTLLDIPGLRYMEAWAQDDAGNISLAPGIDTIVLLPAAQAGYVAQNGVAFYRFYVRQGQAVVVNLVSLDGDADLYVWGPGDQLWYSNNPAGAEDRVAFNAPVTGTYQIEVHGYTAAHYRLTIGNQTPAALDAIHNLQSDKPLPTAPCVPLDNWPGGRAVRPPDWPESNPGVQHKIYLPLIMVNK